MNSSDLEKQNQATSEPTPTGQIEPEKVHEIKSETKSYFGIEYKLVLLGFEDQIEEEALDNRNERQWWEASSTEKSAYITKNIAGDSLILGTFNSPEMRMQDKYHTCELRVMQNIKWIMEGYPKSRTLWLWVEIKMFLIGVCRTMPARVKYYIAKLFAKKQSL